MFNNDFGEVFNIQSPDKDERRSFFEDLILNQAAKPPTSKKKAGEDILHLKLSYCELLAVQYMLWWSFSISTFARACI